MKYDEELARWELFLIIAIPDFNKRAELLKEWLQLWKMTPRLS